MANIKHLLIFLTGLLLGGVFFNLILVKTAPKKDLTANLQPVTATTMKTTGKETESINILLAGYGGAGHPGGTLADSIILLHLEPARKLAAKIFIPRDLWVALPVRSDKTEHHKINMAYAIGASDILGPLKEPQYKGVHGAGNMLTEAVLTVTNIKADYYASVDFDGLVGAINKLGNIKVDVPVTFTDNFYPVKGLENETCGYTPEEIADFHDKYSGFQLEKQFECRYEKLHFEKGVQEISGEEALKFARSRHSSEHGGDFARGERLQAILEGVKDKLLSLDALENIGVFFDKFIGSVTTNTTRSQAIELVTQIGDPTGYEVININISTENVLRETKSNDGQYILVPSAGVDNWEGVQEYIQKQLN